MNSLAGSKSRFESWLHQKLGDELVAVDLAEKNKLLSDSPFVFLRGSYWRWSEMIAEVCPDIMGAPQVLAVGDIHLENFGTWRDAEGRLVWGVNDFDEAAEMPYGIDLVRLATSVALSEDMRKGHLNESCAAILKGYQEGLTKPEPIILERDWQWLREAVVVAEDRRQKFWKKLDTRVVEEVSPRFRNALTAAMPEGATELEIARRFAGTGSLGRPRWAGVANWKGGEIAREAKAVLPSAWAYAHGKADAPSRCADIANGTYRAPDPWYAVNDGIVVRRLSPNNRKVEVEQRADFLLTADMHSVMGRELANIHIGTAGASAAAIGDDIKSRKRKWLVSAAEDAAKAVTAEYKQWKKLYR